MRRMTPAFSLVVILVVQVIMIISQSGCVYAQTFEWQRILNHEGSYASLPKQNATDFSFDVAAGSDGVYIVGRSHFNDGYYWSESADSFLAKYDFSGNLVFDYIMPVPWYSGPSEYDGANNVVVDGKNVFITGLIGSDNPSYGTSYLIVFNESTSEYTADPLTWGGSEYDWEGINSITTYGHELYVVITSEHLRRNPAPWPSDYITDWWNELRIVKFASNLTKIWEKNVAFAPHTQNGGAIAVDSSGIYLVGEFESPFGEQSGSGNYSLVKLDFNGDFLWEAKYKNKINFTEISGMALSNGHIYITGVTGLPPYPGGWPDTYDFFIAEYDTSGNLLWDKVFKTSDGSLPAFYSPDIAIGTDGIYLAGGITKSITGGGNDDVLIVKLDFNGDLLWPEAEWGGTKNDYIEGMTAVGDDAYLTGFTRSYADDLGNYNVFLLKYGAADTTAPVASAGSDQIVNEDTLVTFDGSGSYDDIGIASYVWTFVDGGPKVLTGVTSVYTFANPGVYTVTLNVTDAAGNWATDTTTITVLALTPEDLTQRLVGMIGTSTIPAGTKKSLTSKLEDVLHLLEIGNERGAIGKLMDFIHQVEALRGKKLTDEQANSFIREAQEIMSRIQE